MVELRCTLKEHKYRWSIHIASTLIYGYASASQSMLMHPIRDTVVEYRHDRFTTIVSGLLVLNISHLRAVLLHRMSKRNWLWAHVVSL